MTFLKAAKKPHPNGNYQLGLIKRFQKMDILGDTANITVVASSVVHLGVEADYRKGTEA